MRARKTVLAAATCALVLLPAATAMAGSGPAPAPGKQAAAAGSTAPSAAGNPRSARAQAADVCSDAYQIGTTAYIDRDGAHAASVKQFYSPSCKRNYGYLWVWDSYRTTHDQYDISVGIYAYDNDSLQAVAWSATHQQEFWSDPAATVTQCTSAIGSLRGTGDPAPTYVYSSKRC